MKKRTFQIGTGIFGEGTPKVCVPIVAKSRGEIWKKAEEIQSLPVDIVEWRVDFYEDVFRPEEVLATLRGLKERLAPKDILFTFRTDREGGSLAIDQKAYYELNQEAATSGCVTLVDVEAFLCEERTCEVIELLHARGCHVITSNHDFQKTPDTEDMVRRLKRMEELGADVAKLAVMPREKADVLRLLQATIEAEELLSIPLVTMSMGRLGMISRLSGGLTGSAMTFGAVGETSAPGQLPARELANLLKYM